MGRNYGAPPSALRPLLFWSQAKAEHATSAAAGNRIIGEGWLDIELAGATPGSPEWNAAVDIAEQWIDSDKRWIVHSDEMRIEPRHGGSVAPDLEAGLRAYDAQIRAGLDDSLQGLGQSAYGSRAVSTSLEEATHRSLAGEFRRLCSQIEEEILFPLYWVNNWNHERLPSCNMRGAAVDYQAIARARMLLEGVRDGIWPVEFHDAIRKRAMRLIDVY